ncbi:MAG: ATP-binding protein [Burkholderiales bacterium]|jgi:AAA15 family ATPase/GTPase|nr:ATP-binding protein [Burkholderiales bacterium]
MLVEFRVKNFRSLRDEQVLSLVASKDGTWADTHTFATGLKATPNLLKSAAIYGANASGKSNLIKALQYMRGVVLESAAIPPGQPFSVQSFRLDAEFGMKPSEFEIIFIVNNVRYQYGFAMTSRRIVHEYLLVYKTSKPQRWFERCLDETTNEYVYEFSVLLKGKKDMWRDATRSNALFLSTAVRLNNEALRPVFDWFANDLVILNEQVQLSPQFSIQMLKQPEGRRQICDFLTSADISIANIEIITRKVPAQTVHFDLLTGKAEKRTEEMEELQLQFSHDTNEGKTAIFDWNDESGGTRKLLSLSGPVLDILSKGRTLVVDELDTSLHTLLVRELIQLFHRLETNTGHAQLIFTTHNTSLLDAHGLFRRDQVWFVEKDAQQASALVALSEFSPRKNEALERGYLIGRYGGVPLLSGGLGLTN